MIRNIAILFLVMILLSCKKDKLKDEYEIFIGRWEWQYSIYEYDKCQQGGGYEELLNPSTESATFQIEFFEKGKIKFYVNNIEQSEHRIVLSYFESWSGNSPFVDNSFNFSIRLNNNKDEVFSGIITSDSLFSFKQPYEGIDPSCDEYFNYWSRVK